jgi:hypothetical protein
MIRSALLTCFLSAACMAAEEPVSDMLRFTTGDQLQGTFKGINENGRISWARPDVPQPIEFQRDKVRQIVLHGGHPLSATNSVNHVGLVNGDRIPGRLVSMDDSHVTILTESAGRIEIPRDAVSLIAPNPFGGRLIYAGPFDEASWKVVSANPAPPPDPQAAGKEETSDAKAKEASWKHAGAAWYSRPGTDALQLQAEMPDKAMIRFKLSSRGSPGVAFAFDADFAHPAKPLDEKTANNANTLLSRLFGNAYVLSIYPSFAQLYRCGYDKDGQPMGQERLRAGNSNFNIKNSGETLFELRRDKRAGTIALYIDGEFALQWDTKSENGPDLPPPGGSGIGFQSTGNSAPLRLSDVVVAEWNGLTDSARSMESDQNDIVLLANGTDRFSGHVTAIQDGKVSLDGKYSGLSIPVEDIAEIHLARSTRRKEEEERPASEVTVHLQPVGRISGTPVSSSGGRLKLESPMAGLLDLDLGSAVVLEFQSAGGFLDKWDDDL